MVLDYIDMENLLSPHFIWNFELLCNDFVDGT